MCECVSVLCVCRLRTRLSDLPAKVIATPEEEGRHEEAEGGHREGLGARLVGGEELVETKLTVEHDLSRRVRLSGGPHTHTRALVGFSLGLCLFCEVLYVFHIACVSVCVTLRAWGSVCVYATHDQSHIGEADAERLQSRHQRGGTFAVAHLFVRNC